MAFQGVVIVLRETSALLMTVLRANDVIGRWGGEEFVIVAPESDDVAAEPIAQGWRTAFAGDCWRCYRRHRGPWSKAAFDDEWRRTSAGDVLR